MEVGGGWWFGEYLGVGRIQKLVDVAMELRSAKDAQAEAYRSEAPRDLVHDDAKLLQGLDVLRLRDAADRGAQAETSQPAGGDLLLRRCHLHHGDDDDETAA